MDNPFDAVREAMSRARQLNDAANRSASQMAYLIRGRLRHCDTADLAALKRELRDFNINTGRWKG